MRRRQIELGAFKRIHLAGADPTATISGARAATTSTRAGLITTSVTCGAVCLAPTTVTALCDRLTGATISKAMVSADIESAAMPNAARDVDLS
jgi:hypothetical protein